MCACSLAVDACLFSFIVEELEPLNISKLDPSKVKFASPCIAFAPVTVQTVLLVDPDNDVPADIPVKFAPEP